MPENSAEIMGAYSPGLRVDLGDSEMIFVTGQMSMDAGGNVVCPGDIAGQTERVFQNIDNILRGAGATMNDVVKAQIFLTDIGNFSIVSPIRNKYFAIAKPVSTMVQVVALSKPGCDIEIEVIAIKQK